MGADPSLLRALEAALAADDSNGVLRVHLAELLIEAGDPGTALGHLEIVLRTEPDNVTALGAASRAARMVGDEARAIAWQRLRNALAGEDDHSSQIDAPANDGFEGRPSPPSRIPAPGQGPDGADPGAEGSQGTNWDAELADLLRRENATRVTLADVAGLKEVKNRLEASFLGPLRNPELRNMYGASLRGGLLLWGPPGCGKTFLARAVAGELGARFVSIGLHDVLDMWLGNSEKRVHELFELARRGAPTVLFFDEVDAIGHSRTDLARSASRNVVAQLLAELDGIDSQNDGVFVIGATNQPWDVDPALRRPGRFDRTMLVLPPDEPAREEILRYNLQDRPTTDEPLAAIIGATEGFSGADLKLVCDEACQRAMANAMRTGVAGPVCAADLMAATQSLRPSTAAWFEMANNFATYANTTGEYDELVSYLRSARRNRR